MGLIPPFTDRPNRVLHVYFGDMVDTPIRPAGVVVDFEPPKAGRDKWPNEWLAKVAVEKFDGRCWYYTAAVHQCRVIPE